jgi:hypothetical protein
MEIAEGLERDSMGEVLQLDSNSKHNAMVNEFLHSINQIAIPICSELLFTIFALSACNQFTSASTSLLANPQQFTKEREPAYHL